ncbi:MAG: hypothetical protein HY606_12105 [Planctomycetes bacterium]|nr:hypothetical protein [Planctomycetota bacterium]
MNRFVAIVLFILSFLAASNSASVADSDQIICSIRYLTGQIVTDEYLSQTFFVSSLIGNC